jgi:glutamyl-tRNA reductase
MVDLAVPRDIEAEVGSLDDVFLYTVDDLAQVVDAGLESRQQAVLEAEEIIDTRVDGFLHWMQSRDAVPTIRALRQYADTLRAVEVERAVRLLAKGEDPHKVLDALGHGLINKLLHGPTRFLNQSDGEQQADASRLVQQLFNLDSHD